MALLVFVPLAWFAHVAGEHEPLACTTPGPGMTNVINSIMRDDRTHVEQLQVAENEAARFSQHCVTGS